MRYAKFDPSTGQIISILVNEEENTVEIDEELVNKIHTRPKLMLFYRVLNGQVVHKDQETVVKMVQITPEAKLRSWPTWPISEKLSKDKARVIVTFIESAAMILLLKDFEHSIYITDAVDDMWILGSLDKVETGKLYLYNLKDANVWSKDDYTDCYVVDNDTFERLSK
jgi:hypothetical protein